MIIRDGEASNGSSRIGVPHFHFNDRLEAMVCLHEYKKVHMKKDAAMDIHNTLHNLQRKEAPPKYERPLYWVSLLSTIVSLFFLFISFLIYCLLSSLRTVAGINNLILTVALFVAQLLLQIVADVSMADWLCQVVGVATHFFWLVVTFAQNACTFHMFYTLSLPFRSVVTLANPALLTKKYAFYVIFMSVGFVTATLAWQFGVKGRSGYGGSSCYITKAMVRILMFAAPLAATVLINFAMFVVTIVRLRTQQHVESTRSNHINLVQYTKLSVFTGLTWLLGFLAAFLKSEVMQYVFAVCQGGQGLFVFLAFLANGRVLAMLRERFGCTLAKEETAGKRTTVNSRKTTDATMNSQNATHDTPAASSEVVFLNTVG
ncbi:adhesion G protein-coupled receptor E2-like [Littorina saxatilis]|uniref:adhesion G protein-coupled receptor E2-like n=1 Tax=Littorina saxatilis TaxID=31220 RepID=UPI0038B50AEA